MYRQMLPDHLSQQILARRDVVLSDLVRVLRSIGFSGWRWSSCSVCQFGAIYLRLSQVI